MRFTFFLASMAAVLLLAPPAMAETAAEKAMAQQIGRVLKESGQLRNYRIAVQYQDGVATLTGTVASAEQGNTAVRLARQINGVAHVVTELEYPGGSGAGMAQRSPNLFGTYDDTTLTSAQSDSSAVVHAYANNRPERGQRPMMMAGPNAHAARHPAAGARSNMPLPSRMISAGSTGHGVRQASAQGVHHAIGSYPHGGAPDAMGGAMADGMSGAMGGAADGMGMQAVPVGFIPHGMGRGPSYENAQMPGYAWPSYAAYPNYAALTYPRQYSPTAWPYIGPFYPYPQVPLAWRKVSLEWDDGWWFLDFSAHNSSH
jgi:hypothetical protein